MKYKSLYRLILLKITLLFFITISAISAHSQVYGCKDPAANNYNAAATVNDGSCTYNPTPYTPPIIVDPINGVLIESSGLQMAGNFLWSFNDGGGAAAIYRIDTSNNTLLQTVNIGGATNVDWEDISFDGTYFYVGDFGNNADGARADLKIYKFALSDIPDYTTNPTVTIPSGQVAIINFTYSDQGTPVSTSNNNTKYDCEAMIIDNDSIHLFTKNWIDLNTVHYVINNLSAGTYSATPVDTLATGFLVTAADKAPGQNIVALLGYQSTGLGNHFMYLLSDYNGGKYFNGNKRQIDLPNALSMGQAEGIVFRNSTYGYISNEKLSFVNQKLRSFNTAAFTPLYVLPLTLKSFSANPVNGNDAITWSFDTEVKNLQIQRSTNGSVFYEVKTFGSSKEAVFYNATSDGIHYYRLSWQSIDGATQYSNVIPVKTGHKNEVSGFLLHADGQLSFLVNGTAAAKYSFKLLTVDGKLLSEVKEQLYLPGLNKIYFGKMTLVNSVAYLQAKSSGLSKTVLLKVQK